jgi:hypothetical protein
VEWSAREHGGVSGVGVTEAYVRCVPLEKQTQPVVWSTSFRNETAVWSQRNTSYQAPSQSILSHHSPVVVGAEY